MVNSNNLRRYLYKQGAIKVGFTKLPDNITYNDMNYGISIILNMSYKLIQQMKKYEVVEYDGYYKITDKKVKNIVDKCIKYLKKSGYKAEESISIPHKTIAVLANMGWIGKSSLLVTKEYGAAICIGSVITNCELTNLNKTYTESTGVITKINYENDIYKIKNIIGNYICKTCNKCVEICPANAIKGNEWCVKKGVKNLLDVNACSKKIHQMAEKNIGKESAICGKCIIACPFLNNR